MSPCHSLHRLMSEKVMIKLMSWISCSGLMISVRMDLGNQMRKDYGGVLCSNLTLKVVNIQILEPILSINFCYYLLILQLLNLCYLSKCSVSKQYMYVKMFSKQIVHVCQTIFTEEKFRKQTIIKLKHIKEHSV